MIIEPILECRNLGKRFGNHVMRHETLALGALNLAIFENEFVCVVGPSGCGKTTLLNIFAGFEFPTAGEVLMAGKPILGPGPDRCVVFQEPSLFPWLTVLENITFGLDHRPIPREERIRLARYYLFLVGLGKFENAMPHELSGGMKQKTAIARILALDPAILLMDEPFGALDALSKYRLDQELQAIWAAHPKTVVFVTHCIEEAICLADRVVILSPSPGRIHAEYPIDLPRPRDRFSKAVNRLQREIITSFADISDPP